MYRLAYRLTGNKHDAEDLTQETFVRVFRSLHSYTPGTFEGWLHRITTNLFLDQARRRQRIRMDAMGEDAERYASGDQLGARSGRSSTATSTSTCSARSTQLPPEYRAAVVLCDIEGLSYEEIAVTLGIKLGTVRSRIHRARARLRVSLEHRAPVWRLRRPTLPADGPGMSHLGSRISALVDGQLSVADTEKALAHVAVCPECSAELAASRAARRALASADEVTPNPDLTARLLSLAGSSRRPVAGDPFAPPVRQSRDELASYGAASGGLGRRLARNGSLRGDVGHRRSSVRIAAGSMAGLGAVAAMLFVLGDVPTSCPPCTPGSTSGCSGRRPPGHRRATGWSTASPWPGADGSAEASHQTVAWLRRTPGRSRPSCPTAGP